MMLTIYHNPRCSKSRQTLELIKQNSTQELNIVEYLKAPLNQAQIEGLLVLLACAPIAMMRSKEAEFKEQNLVNTIIKTSHYHLSLKVKINHIQRRW